VVGCQLCQHPHKLDTPADTVRRLPAHGHCRVVISNTKAITRMAAQITTTSCTPTVQQVADEALVNGYRSSHVDQVEAGRRIADRVDEVAVPHGTVRAHRLLVVAGGDDHAVANGDPPAVVVVEVLRERLGRLRHTRLPPDLWYLRMPSAAR